MRSLKKIITLSISLLLASLVFSQTRFSLATDFNLQRSVKKDQSYWAIGQSIVGHFHVSPKNSFYTWFSYYTPGKFRNNLAATAKSPLTTPQEIGYVNKAKMSFCHISFGWNHYLAGHFDSEDKFNLYTITGLGLLMGRVTNTHSVAIDSSAYLIPVRGGLARFKRLTLDLGLGIEQPVGGDIYLYGEAKTLVPVSYYPSEHILNNKYSPLTINIALGVRVLFD